MNRVFRILLALACFALLSQVMAFAQATVYVDDGVAAQNYEATGLAAGTTGGGAARIVISATNNLGNAVIQTTTGTTITGGTILDGGTVLNGGATINGLATLTGGTTITGVTNINGTIIAAGTGNTSVAGTLDVSGITTLTGALNANGGATINGSLTANDGAEIVSTNGDNSLYVDDLGAGIGNLTSGLDVVDATNEIALVSTNDADNTDGIAALRMGPTQATLLVDTAAVSDGEGGYLPGVAHGLIIGQAETTLSGGTTSTTLFLDDGGATFNNNLEVTDNLDVYGDATVDGTLYTNGIDNNGEGITNAGRIYGVSDGVFDDNAVNVRQLNAQNSNLSSGIASIAALNAIPCPVPGKNYSLGMGYGHYNGESAYAIGAKASLPQSNLSLAAGVGFSNNSSPAINAGASFSF